MADEAVEALLQRLRHRRVGVHVAGQLGRRQVPLLRQREFRQAPGLVADGRDMGTVIFPDARLKIFLDASAEARAERRWRQLSQAGVNAKLLDLCDEVRARDERDRKRAIAPLAPAADAIVVDSTQMKPDEVLAEIGRLLRDRGICR